MRSRTLGWISGLAVGALAFGLVLSYQRHALLNVWKTERVLTQENPAQVTEKQINVLLGSLEETMAFYLLEHGKALWAAEGPSVEQSHYLMVLKQNFFEKFTELQRLIGQLRFDTKRKYGDKADILVFRARYISRQASRTPPTANANFNELISAEELQAVLMEHKPADLATDMIDAIEKFLTYDIAANVLQASISNRLQDQVSTKERYALLDIARPSKYAIEALLREDLLGGLGIELRERHNTTAELFEFTRTFSRIEYYGRIKH